jgi:hypothetical protein
MTRRSWPLAPAIAALLAAGGAMTAASQPVAPFPRQVAGNGSEQTSGGGRDYGVAFRARSAIIFWTTGPRPFGGRLMLEIVDRPAVCARTPTVSGPPLRTLNMALPIGRGALPLGRALPGRLSFSKVIAPGRVVFTAVPARATVTRVDTRPGGIWHGRLVAPGRRVPGAGILAFQGTFAARWCGSGVIFLARPA